METTAVDNSSRLIMMDQVQGDKVADNDDLVGSNDDYLTESDATQDAAQGTSVSDETNAYDGDNNTDSMEVDLDSVAAEADNEDFMMEVEQEPSKQGVVDSTTHVVDAVDDDDDDEDTSDVLDLEKLYDLLEQSKSAGDLIDGKNVMLLIGGTGAGKVSFYIF